MLAGKTATTSCTTFPDFSHSLGVVVVVFVILVGWLHYKFKTRVKSILLFKKIKLNKINTIFKHKIQLIWNSFTNKENLFEHCLLFTKQNKKQEIGGEELAKEREIPPSFFSHRGAHQNNNNHEKWNVNKHVTVKTGHFSKQKGGWRVWRKIETGTILLPVCCYPQVKWRGLFFFLLCLKVRWSAKSYISFCDSFSRNVTLFLLWGGRKGNGIHKSFVI